MTIKYTRGSAAKQARWHRLEQPKTTVGKDFRPTNDITVPWDEQDEIMSARATETPQDAIEPKNGATLTPTPENAPTTSAGDAGAVYDVGDPDADVTEAQDPRLTAIISTLNAQGELEMFDAIRVGVMLFKGEVPHMELV